MAEGGIRRKDGRVPVSQRYGYCRCVPRPAWRLHTPSPGRPGQALVREHARHGPRPMAAAGASSLVTALTEQGEDPVNPVRFLGDVLHAVSGILRRESEFPLLVLRCQGGVAAERVPEQMVAVNLR
jgi:hypothetical protein